ncbi:MAG: DUF1643 domain-containing protein [Acidobacteria bacterium]|nr:DUF1643 domain-containing protein [Acidobacteriota bacterium]
MAETFIPAAKLKQQYHCLGHFYRLLLKDGTIIPCRSVLEILKTDKFTVTPPKEVEKLCSDALVIMMNPGSSRPFLSSHNDALVPAGTIGTIGTPQPLVPTVPDTTQYQIMRLMAVQNWYHIRIVNLSDLRNADSNGFLKEVFRLEKISGGAIHSIFSIERRKEWKNRLSMNLGPVIAGWGQNPRLAELASRCVQSMDKYRLVGVQTHGAPLRFAHPSPRNHAFKLRWLSQIILLLRSESANI